MTTEIIQRMQNQLDAVVQVLPDEEVEQVGWVGEATRRELC